MKKESLGSPFFWPFFLVRSCQLVLSSSYSPVHSAQLVFPMFSLMFSPALPLAICPSAFSPAIFPQLKRICCELRIFICSVANGVFWRTSPGTVFGLYSSPIAVYSQASMPACDCLRSTTRCRASSIKPRISPWRTKPHAKTPVSIFLCHFTRRPFTCCRCADSQCSDRHECRQW